MADTATGSVSAWKLGHGDRGVSRFPARAQLPPLSCRFRRHPWIGSRSSLLRLVRYNAPVAQNASGHEQGPPVAVWCPGCEKHVAAMLRGEIVQDDDDDPGFPALRTRLLQCQLCESPILVLQVNFGGEDWSEPNRLYPTPPHKLHRTAVPSHLIRDLEEAQACSEASAYTATVIMARRVLEGLCADHGVKERTLSRALRVMASRGLLDGRLLEWADGLRVVGNLGAHRTRSSVQRQDALDALAFAEAVLTYLYVLTKQFDQFKARLEAENRQID
jgi:Domain of unknown function (DUF4145)